MAIQKFGDKRSKPDNVEDYNTPTMPKFNPETDEVHVVAYRTDGKEPVIPEGWEKE